MTAMKFVCEYESANWHLFTEFLRALTANLRVYGSK